MSFTEEYDVKATHIKYDHETKRIKCTICSKLSEEPNTQREEVSFRREFFESHKNCRKEDK